MIDVYAVKAEKNLSESVFNKYLGFLDPEKQLRIKKFQKFEDAQKSLISDILVRAIIKKSVGISSKEIIFDHNEYGKPFLRNFDGFKFNISHSAEWVVCAAHNLEVGVDIEKIAPIDFEIARRFFSKREYSDLMSKDNYQQLPFFYELWSLKESYIKAVGKGLSISLKSFSISVSNNDIKLYTENQFNINNYYFKQYNIDHNYKMAACGCKNNFNNEVIYIEVEEILEQIL